MKITIENYILKSNKDAGYDLIEMRTINKVDEKRKPTGETHVRPIDIGYNMSIEKCIAEIIRLNLHKINNTVDFNGFLALYRAEQDRLIPYVKHLLQIA